MDGTRQSDRPDPSEAAHPRPWRAVYLSGCAAFRKFVLFLVAICLLLTGGWWVAHRQFGPIVGRLVESKLAATLQERGLTPRIGSAEFVEGQGIWLRDLTITSIEDRGTPLLEIDELLIRTDAPLWRIVSQPFRPDRIVIRHLRGSLTPDESGKYAVERLFPLPSAGDAKVPISVVDASLSIGATVGGWRFEEHISDLKLELLPEAITLADGRKTWSHRLSGDLRTTRVGHLAFDGRYREFDAAWEVAGRAEGLKLSTDLVHAGGGLAGKDLSAVLRLDGLLDLDFALSGNGLSGPLGYRVAGGLRDGRVDDSRLPDPIVDLQGTFEATPERWTATDVRARAGQGSIALRASRTAALGGDRWEADLSIVGISLDPRLGPFLPASVRRSWDEFRPDGLVDAEVRLEFGPEGWRPDVRLTLHDVSLLYRKFPYPVHHCRGRFDWSPSRLVIDAEGQASGGRVRLECDYADPGPNYTGKLQVTLLDRIPISEELFGALAQYESTERAVREFDPRGQLTVQCLFERVDPSIPPQRTFVIELFNGSLRYRQLPYTLHNVSGRVIMQNDEILFRQITGQNDGGSITCNGKLSADRLLTLDFDATTLALDEELRKALPAPLRSTWDQLRPQGHLDHLVSTYVRDLAKGTTWLTIEAQMWERRRDDRNGVSVRPTWFPYHWQDVTGTIRYDNGQLSLEDLRGHHRETTFSMRGIGRTSNDGWWLDLTPCSIDRLEPTDELLESLPPSIAQGIRTIDLDGRLNLHGRIVMMSGARDPEFVPPLIPRDADGSARTFSDPLELQWDMAVDLQRVGLTIAAQRLHDAHGRLDTVGVSIGPRVECFGALSLDSVMWRQAQLLDIRGPVYLDSTRLAIGSTAPQAVEGSLPQPASAAWIGGRLELDAQMLLDRDYPYMVQAKLNEGRLELAKDEFEMTWNDLAGSIYAGIRLEGSGMDPQSMAGQGQIRLREAAIYELPLVVSLLKLLSIRQVDSTAFTSSDIDYRIERDRVVLDRVDLSGDAISLVGKGELDFHRRLQAQFHTQVGRAERQVPLLTPLFGAASRQLMLINVGGTLDNPIVTKDPFPRLNEALQAMAPEPLPVETLPPPAVPRFGGGDPFGAEIDRRTVVPATEGSFPWR